MADTPASPPERSRSASRVYDLMSEAYRDLFWEDDSDAGETIRFLDSVVKEGSILDAGCGPGNMVRHLAAKGHAVVGVDLSEGLLRVARREVPGVGFAQMDVRNLGLAAESFDGIYSAYSFMHIPNEDVPGALVESRRVLRPGGVLFLAAKAGSGEAWLEEPLAGGVPCYFNFFDPDWLKQQVELAGFRVLELVRKFPVTEGELPNEKLIFLAKRP